MSDAPGLFDYRTRAAAPRDDAHAHLARQTFAVVLAGGRCRTASTRASAASRC